MNAMDMAQLMEECIRNCAECSRICLETRKYCIEKGGQYADPQLLQRLDDCIETCNMSRRFMITESELHPQVCGICAEACRRCAESCEAFPDDEQLKKCAEICRMCEESCSMMAQSHH